MRHNQWLKLFFMALIFPTFTYASNLDQYTFSRPEQALQFSKVTQEVRCVVCENQSLADSNAPIALDLKEKIQTLILANQTNEQINNYLVKRYGEFILLRPRFNAKTYFLWLFPFVGLTTILLLYFYGLPKRSRR